MLLGIGLRAPEVLNHNPIFGFDQGRDYLAVRKIVVERKPTLIGSEVGAGMAGLQYIFHGPYYYYTLVAPFILFGGDPYGGLVLMFVFGVASLFLGFFFVKKSFGVKMALIATLLLAVALSAQSRFIWNSHPATFFILLVFWAVYKLPKNQQKYFFLANFLAGIIYGFQLAISVTLILTLFLFAFSIAKIKNIKVYFYGILGVILAYLPFFGFEFRHGLKATRNLLRMNFAGGFKNHLSAFWFNFCDTFYVPQSGHWWLLGFLVIAAIYFLLKQKTGCRRYFVSFLLLMIPVTFSIFVFLDSPVWGHYLIHLHLAYILLFSFFLTKSRLRPVRIVLCIFLLLMAPRIWQEIGKAHQDYYDHGGVAKMRGKLEAIDYLYQDADGEEFNVLVFTPPVYDYAYQYLLTWYGQKQYGYLPGNKKEGLFYLWIEPEHGKPWTYQGWLETIIKTGRVLKEEKLPGGFIIQKRYAE